jgi:ABC-type glycerol-3-phosphate transport system substrate-binding protein
MQGMAPSVFLTGKVGMHRTANWVFPTDARIKNFEWGIAALPWPSKRYGLARKMPLYPDQWMVLKGQKNPAAAWALQSWLCGSEGMLLWMKNAGALPARKSLAGAAKTLMKGYKPNITEAEANSVLNSANFGHITPSHAVVNWSIIGDQVVNPALQLLQLGHLTGKQAVDMMTPKLEALLKQYPPQ